MFRSCKLSSEQRSGPSITNSFLSMTGQPITPWSELRPRRILRVIRFEKNAGQSAAIYAGLQAARGAILVLIDGDLQNDPADIPKLVGEISRGADLVCGYRAQRRDTRVKRLTSRIANAVRSRYTKDGVRDTGCTLKAMRRECVSALFPFKGMHRFIPALIKTQGTGWWKFR